MSNQTSPVVTMGDTAPPHIIHSTNGCPHDLGDAVRAVCAAIDALSPADRELLRNIKFAPAPKVTEHVLWWSAGEEASFRKYSHDTHSFTIRYTGDTLPAGTYTGPDGAVIVVEDLP